MFSKITFTVCLLIVLAVSANAVFAQGDCQMPKLPALSSQQNIFNEEQEVHLGDVMAEQFQRDYGVIEDDALNAYLRRVGERLLAQLPQTKLRFQFFLVEQPDINSFSLPGGRIYISRKLIIYAKSEDEVAGVISSILSQLIAGKNAAFMTYLFRKAIGVKEVTDRRDIFEKYHLLIANVSMRLSEYVPSEKYFEDGNYATDKLAIYLMARTGYDPKALSQFWDRYAETKGQTGSRLTDFFGITKPEQKRLRLMLETVSALSLSCLSKAVAVSDEFAKWQKEVGDYNVGKRESIRGLISKVILKPKMPSDISRLRFSFDGKYILAQDETTISILTREPFKFLFRINAPNAQEANFTPDSQKVVFMNGNLRVEHWDIASRQRKLAVDLLNKQACLQSKLSPDGKAAACIDDDWTLFLFDVETNSEIVKKDDFYKPNEYDLFFFLFSNSSLLGYDEFQPISIEFSPDSRYFIAGDRNSESGSLSTSYNYYNFTFDLKSKTKIELKGDCKKLVSIAFAFVGADRIIGVQPGKFKEAKLVKFPSGDVIETYDVAAKKISAVTKGDYSFINPLEGFPIGILDLKTKKLRDLNTSSVIDIYDDVYVNQASSGEIGLYKLESNQQLATTTLPAGNFGGLQLIEVSNDFRWLAVSGISRGGVWNLENGANVYYTRGFNGAYFADDGNVYADYPAANNAQRAMFRLSLNESKGEMVNQPFPELAKQNAGYVVSLEKTKDREWILHVSDSKTLTHLWATKVQSKEGRDFFSVLFNRPAFQYSLDAQSDTLAVAWSVSRQEAKDEIKQNPALKERFGKIKEKTAVCLIKLMDAKTGKLRGHLLVEKVRLAVLNQFHSFGDLAIVSDKRNRMMFYSLSTGEQKGTLFGTTVSGNKENGLLAVVNENEKVNVYDAKTLGQREQFIFSSPVYYLRYSADGKKLFVLTADQTVYVLNVSAPANN